RSSWRAARFAARSPRRRAARRSRNPTSASREGPMTHLPPTTTRSTTYIGVPTSRVDGRVKVTGTAKYAAEYNLAGLAPGFVITSAIARGRIRRIDASDALAVDGVIDVITHENRPKLASSDDKYHDDVAPPGVPYRPLYDDKIRWSGQPVALVVAEDLET